MNRFVPWLLLALASSARAGSPEDWVGVPLAGVVVFAPEGGLPEESLDPLLRAQQGRKLDPATVRLDLATLYRVGAFRAVEAHVEPALSYDEQGREIQGALLTYEVFPAPTVSKVEVEGVESFSTREILEMAGVSPGQGTWFPELERERLEERIEDALARQGWIRARVTVGVEDADGGLELTIRVEEGVPNVLEQLAFAGDVDVVDWSRGQRRLRRWARQAGVVEGKPFHPEAINDAQVRIQTELAELRPGLFQRPRGWTSARVNSAMMRTGAGTARVTFTIDPGPRLVLAGTIDGLGATGRRTVEAALGIDERLRITRGWLEDAPERLETALRRDGYDGASVEVRLDEHADEGEVHLVVNAQRGPRHRIKPGGYPSFIGVRFDGNETLTDPDLQRVLDQASEEVLRRDYYAKDELLKGLAACEVVYTTRGHLEADLALVSVETRPRRRFLPFITVPVRTFFFPDWERPVLVLPEVTVDEGPLTMLGAISVVGSAKGVPVDDFVAQLDEMIEGPYSPQRIEMTVRRMVEAHRARGFLEADASIATATPEPLSRSVVVTLDPGVRVRLRSKVTRGLNRTRPAFVRREADIELGDPVTPAALDRVRSNLYDLGVFRSVKLELLGDEEARDLVIDVTERPRFAYEWGFGVSTDQGLRSFGRITWRNLWGRAHRIDLIGQVGLVYGSDAVTDWLPDITQPDWRLALSYTAPRFPLRSQQMVFDIVRERRLERTWRMARLGGGAALETELAGNRTGKRGQRQTTLRVAPRIETRQLDEVDTGALLPGDPWIAPLANGVPSLWRVQEQIAVLLLVDRRDDPILPRRGLLSTTTAELAPGLPWDEWRRNQADVTRFLKAETRLSTYFPLGGFVLEFSGAAAHAFALDDGVIPLEDRYRLGGTGSVRGFVRDAIGPRNQTSRVDIAWPGGLGPLVDYATRNDPQRWVPTGGDTRAVGTAELLLPLPSLGLPNWEGYAFELFADVGNVWILSRWTSATTDLPEYQRLMPALRVGLGGGMRVETPVGPLQVDLGLNPQAAWAKDPTTRELLVGFFEEPRWRVHLTLGATF